MLLLNILLALAWIALTGQFDPINFAAGFLIAYLLLLLVQPRDNPNPYFKRALSILRFAFFYIKELFVANFRVAVIVLSPKLKVSPAIVAIPLEATSALAISLLANLITLTPGTLTLDISEGNKTLYVHTIYASDIVQFRKEIKELERRVLEVTP